MQDLSQKVEQFFLRPCLLAVGCGQPNLAHGGGLHRLRSISPLATNVGQNRSNLHIVQLGSKRWHDFSLALFSLQKDPDQGPIHSQNPFRVDQGLLHSLTARQMTVAALGKVVLFPEPEDGLQVTIQTICLPWASPMFPNQLVIVRIAMVTDSRQSALGELPRLDLSRVHRLQQQLRPGTSTGQDSLSRELQ